MYRNVFILMVFFVSTVFSQRDYKNRENKTNEFDLRKPLFIETNIIPSDSAFNCFFTYKIPLNNILFLKDGEKFSGGISLTMEVHKDDVYLKSETVNNEISVDNYELTNSETDFLEGLLTIKLPAGKYLINPTLKLENLQKDLFIKPIPLTIDSSNTDNILKPLVVYSEKFKTNDAENFRLFNSEGIIPYSLKSYNLIIPIADSAITEIAVSIKQNNIEIVSESIKVLDNIGLDLSQINNAVVLSDIASKSKVQLFLLTDFSTKLFEGKAVLTVKVKTIERKYDLIVGWQDKPKTLMNPEFAIKILNHITPGPEVDDLTDGDEEDYYINLVNYWKKFDQNKETAFNEVMNEFYHRSDYAVKEFSTPSNRDGTNTDRGRIYVKYGKPDETNRSYTEKDNTIEIWVYKNINKRFIFSDKNGLGNFTLLK